MDQQPRLDILLADDDMDDCLLIKDAFEENNISKSINMVHNGEDLLNYLAHNEPYNDKEKYPLPDLILLDLNMPKIDGREALKQIKDDPVLKQIPVIILSTSSSPEDISDTYANGANSFITKPLSFNSMVKVMDSINSYWFQTVKLPTE